MLYYRVFPHLPSAPDPSAPGHPLYLHKPQGFGRLDNPAHYDVWYLALEQPAAVGETFADLTTWDDAMLDYPTLPGARRALGTYRLSDDTPFLELDDAKNLLDRNLRPTQVIERNRPVSQAWALRIFEEGKWHGVRWWSYHRPMWHVLGYWGPDGRASPEFVEVEPLATTHPALVDAAGALSKIVS